MNVKKNINKFLITVLICLAFFCACFVSASADTDQTSKTDAESFEASNTSDDGISAVSDSSQEASDSDSQDAADVSDEPVAPENVYVESVCVAGMTKEEVEQVIEDKMREYENATITVNVGDYSTEITASQMGVYQTNPDIADKIMDIGRVGNIWVRYSASDYLSSDGPVIFEMKTAVDEDAVRKIVSSKCAELNVERADMTLAMSDEGSLYVTEPINGVYVSEDETVSAICEYMEDEWHGGMGEVNAVVTIDEALSDPEMYENSTDLLGSGKTSFNSGNTSRTVNIKNAVEKISGTVLLPGEEMSVLSLLIPFDEENGYELASAYEMGSVVDAYGGGVCQVSTTLYHAVLESELEVTKRYAHSLEVSYVEPSLDAAIAESSGKDFKFVNNTDYAIYVYGCCYSDEVEFKIYGCETRDEGRTLEFVSEIIGEEEYTTVYELDSSVKFGYYKEKTGHDGVDAAAYKIVYQDGEEVSREQINSSYYNLVDHTYLIGTNGATSSQISELDAAAAKKDMSAIDSICGGISRTG